MRPLIVFAAAVLATTAAPALAQDYLGMTQARDADAALQAERARQADVATANQLSVLDARQRTDEALATLRTQGARPAMPLPITSPRGATPPTPVYAEIPDAKLAASNAAARAAAENRR